MRFSTFTRTDLLAWSLVLSSVAGCQEYTIGEDPPPAGESNPVDLESPVLIDKIVQLTTPAVDVLWIVDNSSSMREEQTQLYENFPHFMPYFLGSGLDYHIGVVSTDMDDRHQKGKLIPAENGEKWISVDSEAPEAMFQQMSQLGIGGSTNEKGRAAGYMALERLALTDNAGFLRDDRTSGVHVIVVSDESDMTRDGEVSKDEFVGWMNDLRPDDDALATFSSIVNPPDVGILEGEPGTDYLYLTDGIGGIKWPIGSDNWVSVLEQLAIQAAGLKREYFLSQLPVASTIEVQVQEPTGTVKTDQVWTYSPQRNSITFDTFIPLPLSEVLIQYTALSSMVDTLEEVDTPE